MRKVLSAITLSLSALVATSAMADWDHGQNHPPVASHEKFEWREGVILPDRYHDNRYYVNDYRAYKNLHQPAKFERWYKVDGRYVLVNERNHHIIRVIR